MQHGIQRPGTPVATRAARKTSKRHTKGSQIMAAINVQEAISNLKQQAQKQKTAAVLGALGVVASGLTAVGKLFSCCNNLQILSSGVVPASSSRPLLQDLGWQQTWLRLGRVCLATVRYTLTKLEVLGPTYHAALVLVKYSSSGSSVTLPEHVLSYGIGILGLIFVSCLYGLALD